jgi:hypothetical protein
MTRTGQSSLCVADRAPSADVPPQPYSRGVAKKILILWYTAAGTFTWSRDTGCTMALPERRLAAPWGAKLS